MQQLYNMTLLNIGSRTTMNILNINTQCLKHKQFPACLCVKCQLSTFVGVHVLKGRVSLHGSPRTLPLLSLPPSLSLSVPLHDK